MDSKNIEKIRNLANRPFRSLPIAEDLPRLLKHIRVIKLLPDSTKEILYYQYDSHSLLESLYALLTTLSLQLVGSHQEKLVKSTFDTFFKRQSASSTPSATVEKQPQQQEIKDGLENLKDVRLKEALRFLPQIFVDDASSRNAKFMFKLDKPNSFVLLHITPKGIQLREILQTEIEQHQDVDCTIACASAVLTAIISGTMEAATALKGGVLLADNLTKLMEFGKSFQFDKKKFSDYKSSQGTSTNNVPISSSSSASNATGGVEKSTSEDTVSVGLNLKRYFSEVLGEDNKVVWFLKLVNSATMSPAIIELKFALGVKYMTKDVPNTWKFDVIFSETAPNHQLVSVQTQKTEQELKNLFHYQWKLTMTYNNDVTSTQEESSWKKNASLTEMTLQQVALEVLRIDFHENSNEIQRKEVQTNLQKYVSVNNNNNNNSNDNSNNNNTNDVNNNSKISENQQKLIADTNWKEKEQPVVTPRNETQEKKQSNDTESSNNNLVRIEEYSNGDRYEGELDADGKRHGKGVYTTPGGDMYVGEYVHGTREGHGTYTTSDGTRYEGEFRGGLPNGKGVYIFENGDVYHGEFLDDEFHGEGSWSSEDGSHYQGQFYKGKRHGKGELFTKGSTYDGTLVDGLFQGHGIYLYSNGDFYEGEFVKGKFHGYGCYTVAATKQVIEGEFAEGRPKNQIVEVRKLPEALQLAKDQFIAWRKENARKIEERKKEILERQKSK